MTPLRACSSSDAALGDLVGRHQTRAVVDPDRDVGVLGGVGDDRAPVALEHRKDRREVALAVLEADLVERVEESRRLEDIAPQVDLADGELLGRHALGVLRLHDMGELPVAVTHDPPVAAGVELIGGQDGGAGVRAALGLHQARDLDRRDQRMVTRQHHDRAVGHHIPRRQHGRPGALALALLDHLDVVGKALGHTLSRAHDAHDAARPGVKAGIHDPLDHGLAADPVQHLGRAGVHPRAVAGSHDQDREGLGHGARRVAPERGMRPRSRCLDEGVGCRGETRPPPPSSSALARRLGSTCGSRCRTRRIVGPSPGIRSPVPPRSS